MRNIFCVLQWKWSWCGCNAGCEFQETSECVISKTDISSVTDQSLICCWSVFTNHYTWV